MTAETTMARKRLLDFALAAFKEDPNPMVSEHANKLVDAVEEAARKAAEADRDRLAAELEELRQIVATPVSAAGGPEFGRALVGKVNELVDERRHYAIAAQAIGRVRAECDAIVAEVYGQHDEDDDGMREAVRRIRAALDGTGEA